MVQGASLVGATLDGKYRVEALLGSGSMGTVYRARHLTLDSWRAIKVMRAELAQDAAFVERFQREARLLEDLRHPHLVALYDFAQLPDGAWYIVSEFVEGETLAARLARAGPLAAGEALRLFTQLADGVAAAHAQGVVHRDLSPDNIMISGPPDAASAKVLDFGLAKSVTHELPSTTGYSLVVGKVGYAAPEQMGLVASVQDIDARADVFSLAAVMYRALFGRLPWRVDGLQSYVHDLLIQREADLTRRITAGLEPAWARLFVRALARRRDERTPSVAQLKQDLGDVARRLRIAGAPSAPAPRPRRALFWAGAAALALAAVIGLGLPRSQRDSPPIPAPTTVSPVPAQDERLAPTPANAVQAPSRVPTAVARLETPRPASAAANLASPTPAPATPEVASPATLIVRSSPEADVVVDGQARGRTPLTLALAPGPHPLRLVTAEGERHDEVVELRPGATTERDHRFPGFGGVAITSQPWCEVSIDGGPFEQTPFALTRIAAGRHTLRGRRAGFRPISIDVEVVAGETRAVRLTPERQ